MRHLIIKNFECKYSTLVLSYNKKDIKNQVINKGNKNSYNNLDLYRNNLNTKLIIWDKPENTSFYPWKFLSHMNRNSIYMTKFNKSILIGIMLSDGSMEKNKNWNPRIRFEQSIKYLEYIWYLFHQLSILIKGYPLLIKRKLRNKIFYSLAFRTRRLNCLNEIYDLFYNLNDGKRCLNFDLYHYFDYIVLAHWIMGDGSKSGKGVIICTDSFTLKEVIFLMNILKIKYDIDSSIHYNTSISPYDILKIKKIKVPRIYINGNNLDKIRSFIKPYFLKCFLYKII